MSGSKRAVKCRSAAARPRSGSRGAPRRAAADVARPRSRSRRGSACRCGAGSRAGRGPSRRAPRSRRDGARTSRCRSRSRGCPPASYSAIASAWPGYSSGGTWGRSARASRYTAWPPIGCTTGTPARVERLAEVGGRADPVAEVVVVDGLAEALRDRLEVAPGEPAVGREPLGEDQQVAAALGEVVVVHREPAADVGERVLLRAHRHAVGERRRSRARCPRRRGRPGPARARG